MSEVWTLEYDLALNGLARELHDSVGQLLAALGMNIAPVSAEKQLRRSARTGRTVLMNDKQKAREVLLALLRQQPQHKMAQQALEMLH